MKGNKTLIALLCAVCVLLALIAFFLPDRNGLALSYAAMSLSGVVGILCVTGMIRYLLRGGE
ncbi:MAG: hypothetical protein J5482_05355 [Oscillospiraceae bacterium]|nr:hypothetical protein [Oscillospiraceae bacterium]